MGTFNGFWNKSEIGGFKRKSLSFFRAKILLIVILARKKVWFLRLNSPFFTER